ncbi:MAG TPA: hypothetical protein VG711_09250 [Phycisphaerales bacterium]|nr:hypothetical protein [Phycisphaerales bacterium]
MRFVRALAIGVLMIGGSAAVMAQQHEAHAPAQASVKECPQFEAMKKLAGVWKGTGTHDDAPIDVEADYKITAGGSVVMETLFPGTDHEMVTMYHMVGKDLMLTHYCVAGNQPTMKLKPGSDPSVMKFDYAGSGDIDVSKDMHMHNLEITLVDADHIKAKWTSWAHGNEASDARFDLMRKQESASNDADKSLMKRLLAKCVGEWTVDATWAGGNPLHAREVHALSLDGTVLRSQTFVTKDDGSEYQRYEMVSWWDNATGKTRFMEWVYDGTTEQGEIIASDDHTLMFPPRVDADGKTSPIRQWLTFVGDDEYDWTVKMKQEDGSEKTLIEGKWMRKK